MKLLLLFVLVLFIAAVGYMYYTKPTSTFIPENVNEFPWNTPPDWTFDWNGGHGKDRHNIMMEPGPYFNPVDLQMIPNQPNF